jgi:Co/Zn/Cd efflux system component
MGIAEAYYHKKIFWLMTYKRRKQYTYTAGRLNTIFSFVTMVILGLVLVILMIQSFDHSNLPDIGQVLVISLT